MTEDRRSAAERLMWERIGPPLYYCADCMLEVKVYPKEGEPPVVQRRCEHTGQIMAPRRAIVSGTGKLNTRNSLRMLISRIAASMLGRTV